MKKIIRKIFYIFLGLMLVALATFAYKKFFSVAVHLVKPPCFSIQLDTVPEKRWEPVIEQMGLDLLMMFDQMIPHMLEHIKPFVYAYIPQLIASSLVPEEYKRELQGVVQSLNKRTDISLKNITYENLLILSLAYDLTICCLSGIVVGASKIPYLFRNFDLPGAYLRKIIVTIAWYKQGKLLFTTIGFPFVVSVFTGQRAGAFAVALNARRTFSKTLMQQVQQYVQVPINVWSAGILVRYALEYTQNYHDAYVLFKSAKLMAPAYIALVGMQVQDGVVLARDYEHVIFKDKLSQWLQYYPLIGKPINHDNPRSPVLIDPRHAQTRYIVIGNSDIHVQEDPLVGARKRDHENKCGNFSSSYRRNSALNNCCLLKTDFGMTDLFDAILLKVPVRNKCTIYASVMCPVQNIETTYCIW